MKKIDIHNRSYIQKIDRVCDFVACNLDGDLSLEKLSQVAGLSKYHFHRLFFTYTGINVAKYILLMRLKRASYQLVFFRKTKIFDIALEAGFDNPETFSRGFRKVFNQTPTQFRKKPNWDMWHEKITLPIRERTHVVDIEIVNFKETKIAVLEHRGSPELINTSVSTLIDWRKQSGLSPIESSKTFGLVYDDPNTTEPKAFRFDLCAAVETVVPKNNYGILNKVIPQGRCAKLRHKGSHKRIDKEVHYLYGEWLPNSGELLRGFPVFFDYINMCPKIEEHELITDIYLPLM